MELTAWAVGIENTPDTHVDAVLVVEAACQSLGDALPLAIARAWTGGVDVARLRGHHAPGRGGCTPPPPPSGLLFTGVDLQGAMHSMCSLERRT